MAEQQRKHEASATHFGCDFPRFNDVIAAVYQHASGSLGLNPDGTSAPNVAAINTLPPASTQNQVAAALGLRHRF